MNNDQFRLDLLALTTLRSQIQKDNDPVNRLFVEKQGFIHTHTQLQDAVNAFYDKLAPYGLRVEYVPGYGYGLFPRTEVRK